MQYHKIQSIYKRDMDKKSPNYGKFIIGQWTTPEFEYLQNNFWQGEEKIDGMNIRIFYNNNQVEIKGKTDRAEIPKHLLEKLQELFPLYKLQTVFETKEEQTDIIIYGEGCGYKIQKNGQKYFGGKEEVGFILFDIRIGKWWLKREDKENIAKQLEVPIVPVLFNGTLQESIEQIKKGIKSNYGNFLAEGLVLRPSVDLVARNGARIITKIKHIDFGIEG